MYRLLPSNSCSSSNNSLVQRTITKMAYKWPPPINLLLWTICHNHLLPDYLQISYIDYFYQTLAFSNNQDGRQNGRHLSVYTCGHSNLVIYHPSSSKFHTWTTFIKQLFMSEYGFCPMNDYQYFRHNGYPLFAAGH